MKSKRNNPFATTESKDPLNRSRTKIYCSASWPCKRIRTCHSCTQRRGEYFIEEGTRFCSRYDLTYFVTISWLPRRRDSHWEVLLENTSILSKHLGKLVNKHIRVLSISEGELPHVHMLIDVSYRDKLFDFVRQRTKNKVDLNGASSSRVEARLGYMFFDNFIPTFRRTDRPRRLRLLSGSRGILYGYPPLERSSQLGKTTKIKIKPKTLGIGPEAAV